jgi:hypothetical protein
MKTLQNLLILVIAASLLWSCEDDIYPELESAEPQIIIDAWVNNSPQPQYIRITETLPYYDSLSNSGIDNAIVYIIDNDRDTRYDFYEISPGVYEWIPSPDYPQIGTVYNSYNLNVQIGDRFYYATSTLNRVPDIDSIVFSYREESIYPDGYYAQFFANDIVGPGDTYWIKAYKNGNYLNKPNEINVAFDAGYAAGSNIDGTTFMEMIREMINPYDDDPAGEILPSYEPGDSVFVAVHSITNEAFTYLTELRIQTDRPGGFAELFSVPLANVPTNIISTDPADLKPLGFFNMSSVSSLGQWLDPENLPVADF